MSFQENLIRARKARGMTQEELAAKLNVSRQAVSKWETGESLPDLYKLAALADELGVSTDELCGREPAALCGEVPATAFAGATAEREAFAEEIRRIAKQNRSLRYVVGILVLICGVLTMLSGYRSLQNSKAPSNEITTPAPLPDTITISGLTLTDSLSPAGLFLTLERGAFVHALKVEGQVAPGGTKEAVGGIVGRNYGTLEECSFFGVVKGDSAVGGIAGRNEAGGLVANCTVSGSVSANRYTGGIAGYNLGTLRACINSASVNTANVDPTLSLDDLSIDPASSLTDLVSVGAVESRNATSDTGGIAGYSSGSLLSCINRGAVGYPHFGYNVGGGAGRSDGFVDFCSNYGMIYGRKDVGGIVGQMEPHLRLSLRDDLIPKLRAELDKLNALVSSTLDDVDSTNDHISSRLDSVSAYTNAAVDDADSLAGQTTDFIDKNIGTVNEKKSDHGLHRQEHRHGQRADRPRQDRDGRAARHSQGA